MVYRFDDNVVDLLYVFACINATPEKKIELVK